MNFSWSTKGLKDYEKLPGMLQDAVDKQLRFLLMDLRYPSLRAKKYDESRGIWQARITDDYRLYFQIIGDMYYLLAVIKHPK